MSKKGKTVFVCQDCGYESPKWMGQCICGAWNTMTEEKVRANKEEDKRRRSVADLGRRSKAQPLASVAAGGRGERLDTGISELNRVLGGGLVKGSLTLISGEPGIGKSTIIMQVAHHIAEGGGKVLYVSGEESEEQLKMRADRICGRLSPNLFVLAETNLENISLVAEKLEPAFIILDSIQTMYIEELDSPPGSVSQVRACGNELMRIGKIKNIPIFIVAHVTKSGDLAGPKIVEHLVDCILSFAGERNAELRIMRAFKNRFGTTSEVGAFEMGERGLVEIRDLSKRFLEHTDRGSEGSMITAVYEGTRPLLMEIQALVAPTGLNFPRRTAIGLELSRLNMILAVLERKVGIPFYNQDVYVNVVGGLRPEGTSTDLAAALAIYSSYGEKVPAKGVLALGEIGLTGDLRIVQNAEKIIGEAARMGYQKAILPQSQRERMASSGEAKAVLKGMKLIGAKDLREAISTCFED